MPTPGYMSIKGAKQGNITQGAFTADSVGNIWQKGHEDQVLVQAFHHNVTTPTDPQSGMATGQRVHKPMVITKVFDKSSPMLYQAQCTNENLTEVLIKWYRTNAKGQQEHYFTHKLTDATIVDITARMPNCQDPSQAHFTHLEDIAFAYRKIEWTHEKCGTAGFDDWQERT